MTVALLFTTDWEALDEGAPEDRACFAGIGIQCGGVWLTEGQDSLAGRLRQKPLLSAYRLAEWIASNWWRLRWEPRAQSLGWRFAHRMANIGSGYVWPDITISSDGVRTALVARASSPDPQVGRAFRYLSSAAVALPSEDFEGVIDEFLSRTIERLADAALPVTELEQLWSQVLDERAQPTFAHHRKLEALLGHDPDESADEDVARLLEDQAALGSQGLEELAADCGYSKLPLQSAASLNALQEAIGFTASEVDLPRLPTAWMLARECSNAPAWSLGVEAARAIRANLGDTTAPLGDSTLCALAGMPALALASTTCWESPLSFALRTDSMRSRVVLRGKRSSGRRFELSRLLGDRLMNPDEPLLPASRAYTFRQKAQRAFAAELLSPFVEVLERLKGDYSSENQMDVAEQFNVSVLTVTTQLVNHQILGRTDLESAAIGP